MTNIYYGINTLLCFGLYRVYLFMPYIIFYLKLLTLRGSSAVVLLFNTQGMIGRHNSIYASLFNPEVAFLQRQVCSSK